MCARRPSWAMWEPGASAAAEPAAGLAGLQPGRVHPGTALRRCAGFRKSQRSPGEGAERPVAAPILDEKGAGGTGNSAFPGIPGNSGTGRQGRPGSSPGHDPGTSDARSFPAVFPGKDGVPWLLGETFAMAFLGTLGGGMAAGFLAFFPVSGSCLWGRPWCPGWCSWASGRYRFSSMGSCGSGLPGPAPLPVL